jgi:hypothetical protein
VKSSSIQENQNFYWDEDGFLCHFTGEYVGKPRYRFHEPTDEERKKYICYEKSIQITPNGVLVEYDSNCFDIEDEISGHNRNDDNAKYSESELSWATAIHSGEDKRRHYINKMFYNNNNKLVFEQEDYAKFATLLGDEMVHLCDSEVALTNSGISVKRRNIEKEFPDDMFNSIGDFAGSGEKITMNNSSNEKEEEFFTYKELNEKYKQAEAKKDAYWKKKQEDSDWAERHRERLHKFGFNNITLKYPWGVDKYMAYKAWEKSFSSPDLYREF